ncbi:MAG TPA: hypothetical protein DEF45_18195 [Rhodopirellula sp.]|nr:hypothetical protein [Rhodopirellula sp.]
MQEAIKVSLVRCATMPLKRSEMASATLLPAAIAEKTIATVQQKLNANEAKGLHLAAAHPEHGQVTYLQEVTEGGFFVYVGEPDALQEYWFGVGDWVAFNDDAGSGHASKIGPDGCTRTFRMLRGHLS